MTRTLTLTVSLALGLTVTAQVQFEVASVKPNRELSSRVGIHVAGDSLDIGRWSIKQLMLKAYGVETYQVSGPDWISNARFDVVGRLPPGASHAQVPEMLRSLLIQRFGLKTHSETRDLSGYALAVAGKRGPKMQLAQQGFESTPVTLDDLMGENGDAFGLKVSAPVNGSLRLEFTKLPLSALARILGSYLRQPVFDRTGLNGRYQGELEFSVQSADDPHDNSLFSSLQSVGLKLERSKVPVKLIIVDHAEQVPTEN